MNVGEGMWALVGDKVEEAGFYLATRLLRIGMKSGH